MHRNMDSSCAHCKVPFEKGAKATRLQRIRVEGSYYGRGGFTPKIVPKVCSPVICELCTVGLFGAW